MTNHKYAGKSRKPNLYPNSVTCRRQDLNPADFEPNAPGIVWMEKPAPYNNEKGKREIGLFGVFSIAAGAMISSGLFVLPGLAYAKAGPAMIVSYALASFLVIPVLFSKIELSTAMPRSGGNYFFINRSLGPLMGTIAGLADWLAVSLKATFALVGLGALGQLIAPQSGEVVMKLTAIGACLIFAAINIRGTRKSERLQSVLVVGLLTIISIYAAGGLPRLEGERYLPFVPAGWGAVFAVAGMVFVSYGGLTKAVAVSGEVADPKRNLPLGMFLAFFIVSSLYILVTFVTVGLVDGNELSGSLAPLSLGAGIVAGKLGVILVSLGAFCAFATTANSGIMAASRSPMAMSRDGLLPKALSRLGGGNRTPVIAISITASIMIAMILFLDIENLVKTASTMMILMFMLINISLIILRESGIENYCPSFRAPLYPWLQIMAIATYAFLIFEMGRTPVLLSTLFTLLALFWFFGYVNRRVEGDSALMFMVKRILSRHLKRARLDQELMHILLERDDVDFDRFDRLVESCPVLDIAERITVKELFGKIAETLADHLHLSAERFYDLFVEREREGSTVIQPGLAIPHIIIPGQKIFNLVLVRCRPGIHFSDLHAPVHTVFVLVGSADERGYHLRALMNIAQIVQSPGFEERWMQAINSDQLRSVVLLSERQRQP